MIREFATSMPQDSVVRLSALYLPLLATLIVGILRGRQARLFPAVLLATIWTVPTLEIVARLNQYFLWWSFSPSAATLAGMPLEFYFGWVVLWGTLPTLAFPRQPLWLVTALFVALDLAAMPLCAPAIRLGPRWLTGETGALLLVLVPALCLGRWTLTNRRLPLRAALQMLLSGLLFLYFLPELVSTLRPGPASQGWQPLLAMEPALRQILLQLIFLLALPGISAVMEFVQRGHGTPIPYDPPQRLVTSGIYRYCANPMQLSCTLVMLAWAALLRNPWLAAAALVVVAYSAGLANWDEAEDMALRFGEPWQHYRAQLESWKLRWTPYTTGKPARLYIASTCGPCSEIRQWLEARDPRGLEILPAESLPAGSIQRMRYDPCDGTPFEQGIPAMARALEHLSLGWALAGFLMRLPILCQGIQLVMDASGLGPRSIPATTCKEFRPTTPKEAPLLSAD